MNATERLFHEHAESALDMARRIAYKYKLSYHDRCSVENAALVGLWKFLNEPIAAGLNGDLKRYALTRVKWSIWLEYNNLNEHNKEAALKKKRIRAISVNLKQRPVFIHCEADQGYEEERHTCEYDFNTMTAMLEDKLSRQVVTLRFKSGCSLKEISQRTGVGTFKVKSVLSRALQVLRSKIDG